MEPIADSRRHNLMLADTSAIDVFATTHQRHADDLDAVAAELAALRVPADAFGTVGAHFVASLNAALAEQAGMVTKLAERFATARSTAATSAAAYRDAEVATGQSISMLAV